MKKNCSRCHGGACPCACPCRPCPSPCEKPRKYFGAIDDTIPCSPTLCAIFGGLDRPYHKPFDPMQCRRRGGRSRFDDSLGSPVGALWLLQPQKGGQPNQDLIRLATFYKGYAMAFITPRNKWTPDHLDQLIKEGMLLFSDSLNMENPNTQVRPEIYTENEQKISRHFKLDNYEFMIELEPPFQLKGPKPKDNIIDNIRFILKAFFKKAHFGLFWTPNWYLLIWRDKGIYLILDFNGRLEEEFKSNPEGYPVLLVVKSTDNVAYLIRHLSESKPSDKFTLRELLVIKYVLPSGDSTEREYGSRMSEYEVIASDYAYLTSNLHLTLDPKDALRNRSALPVSVATMLSSKVDHPATWDKKTYDKVMCYGVNMCKNCWEPCFNLKKPIDLDSFPRQIRLGQYVIEILLTPNAYEGYWRCVPKYKDNDFEFVLEKALASCDYVLFQINNQMYAIWKKNDFIYLMDPYRHHIVGRILEEGEDPKSASIRMFGSMDRFLSVFHQMLLESNRSAIFHIHTLKIRNITECPPGTAPPLLPVDEDVEVVSLNEGIHFDENYDKCIDELGQISDYEEDLQSEIEPIIELSSSEEMVEEEGGEGEPLGGDEGAEDDED